jgi:hypothetical protein
MSRQWRKSTTTRPEPVPGHDLLINEYERVA